MHEAGAYPRMSREGGGALEVTENMHFYFLNMSIIPFFSNTISWTYASVWWG